MKREDPFPGWPLVALDHLVVAAPVLEDAVRTVKRLTGARATPGGSHPGWGTHNALIRLGSRDDLCYLELIAPQDGEPAPGTRRPFGMDADRSAGSGAAMKLVSWAVRTPDIGRQVAHARACGYDPGEVVAMQRTRPDGSILCWQLTAGPYEKQMDGLLPFLIDWEASPHPSASLPAGLELEALGGESPHPEEAVPGLAALGARLDVSRGPCRRLTAVLSGSQGNLVLA